MPTLDSLGGGQVHSSAKFVVPASAGPIIAALRRYYERSFGAYEVARYN
jgi:hypothetical protein